MPDRGFGRHCDVVDFDDSDPLFTKDGYSG